MPDALQTLTDLYAAHGYWVLFLAVLLENAGIPIPGETALLAAGYLCSADAGHRLHLGVVMGIASLAAILGDNLGYWLGRRFARPRLTQGRRFLFLTPARLAMAESYFTRYGSFTVFFARFVTGLRVVAGPAAGASLMPWSRFALSNGAGAILWAASITLLGKYFGHAWGALRHAMGEGAWILAGVAGIIALVLWIRHRRHQKMQPPPDDPN